jgi:hypothetical protein
VTGGLSAESLLRRPVRFRGIRLGSPADLLVDLESMRAVGVEVVCGDDERRFLPLAAARIEGDEIAIASTLLLLNGDDLGFYRRRGRMLSALRGRRVTRGGRPAGVLRDLVLDGDRAVTELVLETSGAGGTRRTRVPLDPSLAIDDAPASAA